MKPNNLLYNGRVHMFNISFILRLECTQNNQRFPGDRILYGRADLAHISFVHEANRWFPKMAAAISFHL